MDWTQTLTIIISIGSLMMGILYAVYKAVQEDIKVARQTAREDAKRHDAELAEIRRKSDADRAEMRQEFARTHALWAELLQKISDIKLDQVKLSRRSKA